MWTTSAVELVDGHPAKVAPIMAPVEPFLTGVYAPVAHECVTGNATMARGASCCGLPD
jgi:hypothetical protein